VNNLHPIVSQSFKRYNNEQFGNEVADIPWSVVELFHDLNDAVSAWNTRNTMLPIVMHHLRRKE